MFAIYTSSISLVSGGIENTSYLLCEGICDKEKVVAAPMRITDDLNELEVKVLDPKNRRNKILKYLNLFVSHCVNRSEIDYSLCLTWKYAIVPYMVKILFKKPYGVMTHGNDIIPISNHKGIKVAILNNFRNKILRNADHIFANSNYTRDILVNSFHGLDATVIHPPISYIKPMQKESDEFSYVLFSIGRTETRKGFQDCINAVDIIKDKYPNLEYRIAGTGPYLEELKKIVKAKKLEKWVIFLGRITEEEKRKQYQVADIVMMPSRTEFSSVEGFGIVFVEANMFGCPTLGSDSGGISDAVINSKTGWIVHEAHPEEIAEKVVNYYMGSLSINRPFLYQWGMTHSYKNIASLYLEHINDGPVQIGG